MNDVTSRYPTGEVEKPRIVILISGSGSNMLTIADQVLSGAIDAEIAGVICNEPEAAGVQKARDRDLDVSVIDHRGFTSREEFDVALMRTIDDYQPDLVVLAGFMRILTPDLVRRYEGRMLNIHPSLLPKYQGLHTHRRALEAGDDLHGVTVHFVTEVLDDGPNVIQAVVPVMDGDTEETLRKRVQLQEHIIYPIAVKWFVEGRLEMVSGLATFDGKPMPDTGVKLEG
ncbi:MULTISPECIES: phosphoribosylglycinamide formyltransferase [Thalassolituus]|jgi:phosphoribosylglycinamide formyltransferase-1|uniref:phosphoribosylglycinamide formyltransferase n=1 Tax=Thalassolituus TaxID=187492 RepID=UPI000C5D7268|nr:MULTISPECIES: phosphoribosylglycinamide formyltransferase [Thalassolituus]MAX87372.1 phosphoribosylglycinamide formyltransferase [Oceanospirillaceae bacterium]MEE3160707.1 phosphoribosylglycinamide formyltransferase [Pseudomonadota bacterium]TPD55162.1 MAG: phosphoribosylglycinamide formyltransferase [Thalassolituus maritimus]HCG80519.1 phosphoribosylglycinamide formyltransferase [Oceanospirillales bacterium]|tara:strand:+ start:13589 stop:14272 length:684 start_codon:yes stop_codon:yes gene_type:complete